MPGRRQDRAHSRVKYQVGTSQDGQQVGFKIGGPSSKRDKATRKSRDLGDSVGEGGVDASPRPFGADEDDATTPMTSATVRRASSAFSVDKDVVGQSMVDDVASINVELEALERDGEAFEAKYRDSITEIVRSADEDGEDPASPYLTGDANPSRSRSPSMLAAQSPANDASSRRGSRANSLHPGQPGEARERRGSVSFSDLALVTKLRRVSREENGLPGMSVRNVVEELKARMAQAEKETKEQQLVIKEQSRAYSSKTKELNLVLTRETNVHSKMRRRIEELLDAVRKKSVELEKEEERHVKTRTELYKVRAQQETTVKTEKFKLLNEMHGVVRAMEKQTGDKTPVSMWLTKKQEALDDDNADPTSPEATGGVNLLYVERLKKEITRRDEEKQLLLSELSDKDKRIELVQSEVERLREEAKTMVSKDLFVSLADAAKPIPKAMKELKSWASVEITNARTAVYEEMLAELEAGVAAHAEYMDAREADFEARIAELCNAEDKNKQYAQLLGAAHEAHQELLEGIELPFRSGEVCCEDRVEAYTYDLVGEAPQQANEDLQLLAELVVVFKDATEGVQKYKDEIEELTTKVMEFADRAANLKEKLDTAEAEIQTLHIEQREADMVRERLQSQLSETQEALEESKEQVKEHERQAKARPPPQMTHLAPAKPASRRPSMLGTADGNLGIEYNSVNAAGGVREFCDHLLSRANGLDNPDEMRFVLEKLRTLDEDITCGSVQQEAAEAELNLLNDMLAMFAQRAPTPGSGELRVDGQEMHGARGSYRGGDMPSIAALLGDEGATTLEEFLRTRKEHWVKKVRGMYKKQTEFLETIRRLVEVEIEAAQAIGRDPEHTAFLLKKLQVVETMVALSMERAQTPPPPLKATGIKTEGRPAGGKFSGKLSKQPSILVPLARPYESGLDSKVRSAATIVYQSCLQPPVGGGVCMKKLQEMKTLNSVLVSAPREQEISPPGALVLPTLPDGNWQAAQNGTVALQGTYGGMPFGAVHRDVHAAMLSQYHQHQPDKATEEGSVQLPKVGKSPSHAGGETVASSAQQTVNSLSLVDLTLPPENAVPALGGSLGPGSADALQTNMRGTKARPGRHTTVRSGGSPPQSPPGSTRSTRSPLPAPQSRATTFALPPTLGSNMSSHAESDMSLHRAASILSGGTRRQSVGRLRSRRTSNPYESPTKLPSSRWPMNGERGAAPSKACFTLC